MNDNTVLRIKVPAHLYESVKEQLTLTEAKKEKDYSGLSLPKDYKTNSIEVKAVDAKKADQIIKKIYPKIKSKVDKKGNVSYGADNPAAVKIVDALEKAGVNCDVYANFVRESDSINEAKKGKHNLGAGMEIVKEKKMKTPKDGMTKMEEKKDKVEETQQVEEGILDTLRAASDKIFYNPALVNAPKEVIKACIDNANQQKKSNPKLDRDGLIVNCLKSKGASFDKEGSQQGMSAMGGAWNKNEAVDKKKDRNLDELKKAKDMLEMKIKKMEESLQEKKEEDED